MINFHLDVLNQSYNAFSLSIPFSNIVSVYFGLCEKSLLHEALKVIQDRLILVWIDAKYLLAI